MAVTGTCDRHNFRTASRPLAGDETCGDVRRNHLVVHTDEMKLRQG
jgi:hypothetical protein